MIRLAVLLACAALVASAQSKPIPVDEAAYSQLIAASKGKVVVVDFWATWCKPCRAEMPRLVALDSKLRGRGMKLITVSADEPDQEANIMKFLADARVPAPVYWRKAKDDEKFVSFVGRQWSGALPALFVYDKTGRQAKTFFGETPIKDVEAAILKLL